MLHPRYGHLPARERRSACSVGGDGVTLVSVIVLAYRQEPWLERSVRSILASTGVDVQLVLVDNGCTDDAVQRLEGLTGVEVVRPGQNLGFAGGCNAGAALARGEVLGLVNADAVVAPGTLARLAELALEPGVGIATGSIRLADQPDVLNSGGNDIHFLGFSWSGRFGEPAVSVPEPVDVLGASGAGMAMKTELWEEMGGFDDQYFAYHEDAELSLRCWQRGLRVVFVPDAVIVHRYQFTRNPRKHFLIERNRLMLVLTLYESRTLALLGPALVIAEVAMLVLAAVERWWPQKLASWWWLLGNRAHLVSRRRLLQAQRRVSDRELAPRFATHLRPANYPLPTAVRPFEWLLAKYWRVVSAWL